MRPVPGGGTGFPGVSTDPFPGERGFPGVSTDPFPGERGFPGVSSRTLGKAEPLHRLAASCQMATVYRRKGSAPLLTLESHYIPGYAGYCPQYKYNIGQRYSKLTSKLLSDPTIAHSRQLLLQPNQDQETINDVSAEQHQSLLQSRKVIRKGEKPTDLMVSGYTGFIPRKKSYFSKTYRETCADAVADFEREQLRIAAKKQEMELINALQTGRTRAQTEQEKKLLTVNYRTPLKAITNNPIPWKFDNSYKALTSPYFMQNKDPNKHFISGYTGYVPRAQFLLGSSYPTLTNCALIEFDQMLNKTKSASIPTENSVKENETLPRISHIYPSEIGMLPQYTGHIPGYKYQFGHTFGHLTQNALGMSTIQKQVLD
ncbi:protein FAM166B isoform X2 [Chiloscyllium plagiosum]|uniref:protein FAM166B isoform X2 n=1 Tax=Chiloscyllium plagiosum TaxID=36176 RepID=UPI001CB85937|nr:protein FAM166B isoform X2 [Chiloscyllium plagiosum]